MFKGLTQFSVRLVERYLPDSYVFVLILSLIAFVCAVVIEGQSPLTVVRYWGDGFWGLLGFAMQMLLVLISGFMLAQSPPVKRLLRRLAGLATTPGSAILWVSFVSFLASWLNWGFGLVVGALFAKELARQVRVDYRLLVASAYTGFVAWHGGLSGSIPLTIATPGHFAEEQMGLIATRDTLFAFFNLALLLAMLIVIPLVNRLMLPDARHSVYVDPALLKDDPTPSEASHSPADRLENSAWLSTLAGLAGLVYIGDQLFSGSGLNLNLVIFLFLSLAILFHRTPRRLLASLNEAIKGGAGIVIQFPFYAGIMGIISHSGLAETLAQLFIDVSTAESLPFWTFISAGIINLFVPSGGGQWAVQAPVMLPAAEALGADLARIAMAVAWGDVWTNLLQPFWALPVLAIAGLRAKDIMGFCLVQLFVTGVIISLGLTFL